MEDPPNVAPEVNSPSVGASSASMPSGPATAVTDSASFIPQRVGVSVMDRIPAAAADVESAEGEWAPSRVRAVVSTIGYIALLTVFASLSAGTGPFRWLGITLVVAGTIGAAFLFGGGKRRPGFAFLGATLSLGYMIVAALILVTPDPVASARPHPAVPAGAVAAVVCLAGLGLLLLTAGRAARLAPPGAVPEIEPSNGEDEWNPEDDEEIDAYGRPRRR